MLNFVTREMANINIKEKKMENAREELLEAVKYIYLVSNRNFL